jgi:membrane protease YdiL (CAAX protease family)
MSASPPPDETTTTRTNRELWIEVLAVLCLAYFPYMLYAIAIATGWHSVDCPFVYDSVGRIIESFQVIAPLLVILALSKDRWATFGIVRFGWLADVGGGLVLWSLALAIYYLVVAILPRWTDHASERHSQGIAEGCLTLVVCVVAASMEELVMRGYLIARLERLLDSTWQAVAISTAIFASYHIYQGSGGVIGAAVLGLVYAVWFCLFRRLWPMCLAHAASNFVAISSYGWS